MRSLDSICADNNRSLIRVLKIEGIGQSWNVKGESEWKDHHSICYTRVLPVV